MGDVFILPGDPGAVTDRLTFKAGARLEERGRVLTPADLEAEREGAAHAGADAAVYDRPEGGRVYVVLNPNAVEM